MRKTCNTLNIIGNAHVATVTIDGVFVRSADGQSEHAAAPGVPYLDFSAEGVSFSVDSVRRDGEDVDDEEEVRDLPSGLPSPSPSPHIAVTVAVACRRYRRPASP